jgi:hypothetical protein
LSGSKDKAEQPDGALFRFNHTQQMSAQESRSNSCFYSTKRAGIAVARHGSQTGKEYLNDKENGWSVVGDGRNGFGLARVAGG